jgi:hypothetical protein
MYTGKKSIIEEKKKKKFLFYAKCNAFKLDKITEVSTFILHSIQIIHIFYFPYKYFDTVLNIFLLTVLFECCFKR